MKKKLKGKIVSDKMQKTAIVEVVRLVKHPKYNKYVRKTKRYKAHDEENKHKIGERVTIQETRPLSKDKRWEILEK
ncbi:MAG: 30S ribosomal protein S17 [Candidatus Tagabacteria bacterium RIFCSPLOWO2_01_FULL_39_11]|uniref:Small ribosomal subunit protein uS17 n=1 Tax=Candidatus Tagabacteria bacterium RIFCSPLOWO2_01_FULL_39_11 TaxID=1802295 RepID=A0A1G2LPN0_9BACT|nr:MAG: 30S ribosomal protein S17 [Candidatus Tagabacteria bacterium RIFCSPLOWO2_01_FULL_39_11]